MEEGRTREQIEAFALANRVLDRINADPDDDLAILARQLLRNHEENMALRAALEKVEKERAAIEQAISVEFAKKDYTDEDRQHRDLLENLGVFLEHHQELEQELAQIATERDRLRDDIRQAFHKTTILTANELADWVNWLLKYVEDLQAQLASVTAERDSRVDYGWWAKKDVPSIEAQTIIKRWEERWYDAQKYEVNQPIPSFYWVAHQTRCACLLPATEYERNVAYTMMVNKIEYELAVLKLRAAQARILALEQDLKEWHQSDDMRQT